jgi:uncharacterized RDD family membrane protein YckC/cytoskeletal protein CcmA (bactofilin family)
MNLFPLHLIPAGLLGLLATLSPASSVHGRMANGDNRATTFADNHVLSGEMVAGDAVAVWGNLTVDGEVTGEAVAVMGDNHINGVVRGKAVAVMGDLDLGPNAEVDGGLVCIGGRIHRAPGSIVHGRIESQYSGRMRVRLPSAGSLVRGPLFRSHPILAVALAGLLIRVLLAVLLPGAVRRCGDVLLRQPVQAVLYAIITILLLPFLAFLLCITLIGIPVALVVLPLCLIAASAFGTASVLALIGRALSGGRLNPALSVIVGWAPCALLFLVSPILAMILWLLIAFLGIGCVVGSVAASMQKPPAPPSAPAPVPPAPPPPAEPPPSPAPVALAVPAPPSAAPAPLDGAVLPRAGFWIRTAAGMIDLILISGLFLHSFGPFFLILPALYGAIMWQLKATTLGGIICHLKLVRLDGRPITWETAIVRAAGCFISLIALGLGFIWVVFDKEGQSWHDKIAGTTVVRVPRATPLV